MRSVPLRSAGNSQRRRESSQPGFAFSGNVVRCQLRLRVTLTSAIYAGVTKSGYMNAYTTMVPVGAYQLRLRVKPLRPRVTRAAQSAMADYSPPPRRAQALFLRSPLRLG